MMTDAGLHALIALLLPAFSFLVLAVVAPLRRLGRPAAWFSILCAGGSFGAAVIANRSAYILKSNVALLLPCQWASC